MADLPKSGGQFFGTCSKRLVQYDWNSAVRGDEEQCTFRYSGVEHFFQTKCLCAELNLVFFFVTNGTMLILNRIKTYRKLCRWNTASTVITACLNAVTFSQKSQTVGKNRKLIQLQEVATLFYPLRVNTLVFRPALGGVAAFLPEPLIQQKSGPTRTVTDLRQPGQGKILLFIHWRFQTSLLFRAGYPRQWG